MKSKIISLVIALNFIFSLSACNSNNEFNNSSESTNTSEIVSYDYVLNNDEVKTLLKNNTQPDKIIKVCSPIYIMQFNAEQMSVCQRGLMPFDTVIYPVLENKKIVGFLMYQYEVEEEICCAPRFMPISNEAYNKLKKKHALKIAHARWKHGGYYMGYVYLSDDNETAYLFDYGFPPTSRTSPHIQFEYEELTELQDFDLKSLEVIMTFENI